MPPRLGAGLGQPERPLARRPALYAIGSTAFGKIECEEFGVVVGQASSRRLSLVARSFVSTRIQHGASLTDIEIIEIGKRTPLVGMTVL
jgi:hypothetical protein